MSTLFVNTITPNSGDTVTVSGSLTTTGKLTIGDAASDTVAFSAEVSSSIVPDANLTYNLGSESNRWNKAFIHTISASMISGADSLIIAAPNGTLSIKSGSIDNLSGTEVAVDTLSGSNLTVATASINEVSSSLLPFTGGTFALGTMAKSWGSLHVHGLGHIHTASLNVVSSSLLPDATATYNLGTMVKAWAEAHIHGLAHIHTASINVVSSSLIPDDDDSHDLGSSTKQWKDLYVDGTAYIDSIDAGVVIGGGASIPSISSSISVSGSILPNTGASFALGTMDKSWGSLHVHGLGHIHTASIGEVTSSLIPSVDNTVRLGLPAKRWRDVHATTASFVVVSSSLIPERNTVFDLGTQALKWDHLFVNKISQSVSKIGLNSNGIGIESNQVFLISTQEKVNISGSLNVSGGLTFVKVETAASADAAAYSINGPRVEVRNQLQAEVLQSGSWTVELRNTSIAANSLIVANVIAGSSPSIISGSVVTANVVAANTASLNFINMSGGAIPDDSQFTASVAIF